MLVCHCATVTDRAVRDAIAAGARAESEIAARCAAAARCGGCLPALQRLLDAHVGAGVDADRPPAFAAT